MASLEISKDEITIGVLGLQGDIEEHLNILEKIKNENKLDFTYARVKTKSEIEKCKGLIIPGGESTTLSKLIEYYALYDVIRSKSHILGTCAGLILMAKNIEGKKEWQKSLDLLDITVSRNAYGSQIHSFSEKSKIILDNNEYEIVETFIRAPKIIEINDANIKIISKLKDAEITGVELKTNKKHFIGLTFHPELETTLVHEYFIKSVKNYK
ncbi:MAG: pyridoxal 5'-phosphate synthase glutaminase subunit PdxT [Candidatus Anstonellales archaeon]